MAGKQLGFNDARGTLFFDVARILKEKRPKAFLLENVKGLVSHDKGNTFKVILETLNELGYDVHYKILNTKDFNIPQNRERIYIVGFLKDVVSKSSVFDFPVEELKKPGYLQVFKRTVLGDILEKHVSDDYTISDKAWEGLKERKKEKKSKIW